MPIPTIPEIVAQTASGTCTQEQAMVWIELHIGEAVDAAATRDDFATTAMCLILTQGTSLTEVPRLSYELADAMLVARNA